MSDTNERYELTAEVTVIDQDFRLSYQSRAKLLGTSSRQKVFVAKIQLTKEEIFRVMYDSEVGNKKAVIVLGSLGIEPHPELQELDLSDLLD